MTTVDDCTIIQFPRIERPEGNITPVHGGEMIPFQIARIYYLYDVPGGEERGGHSHIECEQLIVSALGSFDVRLMDGRNRRTVTLNRAYHGLFVPRLIWRELVNFSSGAICLVLASAYYDEADYIRDYDAFVAHK